MNVLYKIPLHVLLLAGLIAPLVAQSKDKAVPTPPATSRGAVAYPGLSVGQRKEAVMAAVPNGVGVQVGFIDPQGPSVGKVEEGDVLTRLDDQVLFNAEQFRALIRTRQPGDKVKLTLVRGAEPMVVELTLSARSAAASGSSAPKGAAPLTELPAGTALTPEILRQLESLHGGVLPPEILRQLEQLHARAVPPPPAARSSVPTVDELRARAGNGSSSSRSFSFSFGNGAASSSSSLVSDAEGSVSLEEKDGKKRAVIRDREGQTTFDGDVTDAAAVEKLPAEVRRRLKLVEGKGLTLPGFPGTATPPPAAAPKKKFDPKQGA